MNLFKNSKIKLIIKKKSSIRAKVERELFPRLIPHFSPSVAELKTIFFKVIIV